MEKRANFHITVGLVLIEDNKVLMMKRQNTGYMDGMYALVAGHVEVGESFKEAIIREAKEEVGITLKEENLDYVCAIRRGTNSEYINMYLACSEYEGIEENIEVEKCEEIRWIDIDNLPDNVIENDRRAIYNLNNDISFEEYDF